ncbi:unnamed protein product [Sphagnum tenellum]
MAVSMLAKTVPRGMNPNGKGISAEDQVKLFEPYSFVTSGWVQKAGVSGLGLSIAKRYVEGVVELLVLNPQRGKEALFSSLYLSLLCPLIQA